MSETAQQAYARGVEMGKVAIRLDHHDDQIATLNDLLARTVSISQTNASIVQTLSEARVTDAATRVATAQAVKDAKDAHESTWSPTAKLIAVLGSVSVVIVILWAILDRISFAIGG